MSFTFNTYNQCISLTQGDTFSFALQDDATQEELVLDPADRIYFTVRKFPSAESALIEKEFVPDENGHVLIVLNPEDTNSIEEGVCMYDIQLTKGNGPIHTLIPTDPSKHAVFQIFQGITRPEVT